LIGERVLITGSSGYIGTSIGAYLQTKGYDVIGVDTGFFRENIFYEAPTVPTRWMDVRDMCSTDFEGVDAVVHLAGISNDPVGRMPPEKLYDPTRSYSHEIARICKDRGIRFVFASSCSVYGVGDESFVDEDSVPKPQTPYSLNKLQVEQDLVQLAGETFSPIALRFATIYGPSARIRFDVVINMLCGMAVTQGQVVLNSDGQAWRPNLHISDACEAVHRAISSHYDSGSLLILNVGSDEANRQILDLANIIAKHAGGCPVKFLTDNPDLDKTGLVGDRKIREGRDSRTYRVAFDRISEVFPGYKCQMKVEDGIAQLVNQLHSLNFDANMFKRRGFYRLQHLEDLLDRGTLSQELRWQSED